MSGSTKRTNPSFRTRIFTAVRCICGRFFSIFIPTASNTTNAKKEQLQQQLTADKDYLEQMKTAYAQTNDETLADMIKTKEESIANTQSQIDSMASTVNTGFPQVYYQRGEQV